MQSANLSINLLNQILGYLGTRPYQEVFQLVDAIQKEVQAQGAQPAQAPQAPAETPAEAPAQ